MVLINEMILKETLVNRYLMIVLLNKINLVVDAMQERDKIFNRYLSIDDKRSLSKIRNKEEKISFELFNISSKHYEALMNRYGVEIVSDSTVILDRYLKRTGKRYKNYYLKLKELCERLKSNQMISDKLDSLIQKARQVHYSMIEDKQLAQAYIKSVPVHLQNLDEGCIYLKEKFGL